MKTTIKDQDLSITGPLLEHIRNLDIANFKVHFPDPSVSSKPSAPPDSYQDPGGGYNKNLTYPQK